MEPPDTKTNRILLKIMKAGWEECDLPELAQVHQEVTSATDSLIRRCEVCCAQGGGLAALGTQARRIDQEQKIAKVKACDLTAKLKDRQFAGQKLLEPGAGKVKLNKKFISPCEMAAEQLEFEALPARKSNAGTQCLRMRTK